MAPRDGFGAVRQHLSKLVSSHRYLDNQVFVSLANGELIAYQREAGEAGFGVVGSQQGMLWVPAAPLCPQGGLSLEGC